MNWIISSLIIFPSTVILYIYIRKAQLQKIPIDLYSFFAFLIPLIIFFFMVIFAKVSFLINFQNLILIFITAIFFSYLGNYFSQRGILYAPNPGYINAANSSSTTLLTLLSAIIFKDQLSFSKLVGVIGVTVGMIMLFI